jgi:hypothetical protein
MSARSQSSPLRSILAHRSGVNRIVRCTWCSSGGFGGRPRGRFTCSMTPSVAPIYRDANIPCIPDLLNYNNSMNTPTTAQMRARMNSGHRKVLEAARDGVKLVAARLSDARGYATCRATLIGWGALESGAITALGLELLSEPQEQPAKTPKANTSTWRAATYKAGEGRARHWVLGPSGQRAGFFPTFEVAQQEARRLNAETVSGTP